MSKEFHYRCRTCLSENSSQLLNWTSPIDDEGHGGVTYVDCYRECTRLEARPNDLLPQSICYQCAEKLRDAYHFLKRAKESYRILLRRQLQLDFEQSNLDLMEMAGDEIKSDVDLMEAARDNDNIALSRASNDTSPLSLKEELDAVGEIYESCERDLEEDDSNHASAEADLGTDLAKDFQDCCSESSDHDSKSANNVSASSADSTDIFTESLNKRERSRVATEPVKDLKEIDRPETSTHCETCGDVIASKNLKRHISRKHNQKTFLCHACPRVFKYFNNLQAHAATHQENRERNYTCEQCGRKLLTRTSFHAHLKTHDKNRQPGFQCEYCEKSFFHKGSLTQHEKHHTGKPFECRICTKRYVRAIDLEIHLRSHSGDTPFQCEFCDKSFAQVGILNKHVLRHKGYRYKCEICNKEYLHQSTLISHRKVHTGLPLECSICGKGFVKKSKMTRHIAGVHKVKTSEDIDKYIVRVKTKREYRGRILESF